MLKSYLKNKNKETSVLNTDSFDKRRFNQIYEMSHRLVELGDQSEFPFFKELLGDIWASLYKMNPLLKEEELIPDHLQTNKQMIQRLLSEKSYQEYHESTRLDDLLSAVGTLKFGEETYNWLMEQRKENEEMKKLLNQINDLANKIANSKNTQENNKNQGDQNKLDNQLNQKMNDLANQLSQALNNSGNSFSKSINKAIQDTNEIKTNLEALTGGTLAGTGKGDLKTVPLREKIKLAEIISRDPKIKEIAKWVGRFTRIAKTKQKIKHKESTEQSGVESGDDLERLLPSEYLYFITPSTKKEFMRKLVEKETLQFEQKGKESLGQGSIILCLDQSGSMRTLEEQSKGFTLAFSSIAKKQKRNFAYIPFSKNVGQVEEFPKGKININNMIRIAKYFMGGGTDFIKPLNEALKIIDKDRFNDADIIFITDGEATLSNSFLEKFHKKKEEKKFNVLSLIVGDNVNYSSVESFSDRVINVKDFNDEGSFEAFEI